MAEKARHRPRRLDAPVLRADERGRGRPRRRGRAGRPRRRAGAADVARPRGARQRGRRRSPTRCEPALRTRAFDLQHAAAGQGRPTTACAATRRGSPAATSPTRPATSRVQALVEAVRGSYDIPQRWYRLKARLLGLDRLADYDRMASVGGEDVEFGWDEAKRLVLDSFGDFSAVLADTARAVLRRALDRRARAPGKRGGAFCAYTVPSVAPLRDAQLHRAPPRRADARPRARPRPARRRSPGRAGSSSSTRR